MRHQNHKLVAPGSGDDMVLLNALFEDIRDFLKQRIALFMPKGVVNHLHSVDVADDYGKRKLVGAVQRDFRFVKICAVVQSGQRIVVTDILDSLFPDFALRNIAADADQSDDFAVVVIVRRFQRFKNHFFAVRV